MPSYLREPSGATCWNCDRDADETIEVALHTPQGAELAFRLCGRCYDRDFIPLVMRADGIATAPRPGPTASPLT